MPTFTVTLHWRLSMTKHTWRTLTRENHRLRAIISCFYPYHYYKRIWKILQNSSRIFYEFQNVCLSLSDAVAFYLSENDCLNNETACNPSLYLFNNKSILDGVQWQTLFQDAMAGWQNDTLRCLCPWEAYVEGTITL